MLDIKRSLKYGGKLVRAVYGPWCREVDIDQRTLRDKRYPRYTRSYFTVSREKVSPTVFRCRIQRTRRCGCVGLGGRSWWLMAIKGRRLERKRKKCALTYVHMERQKTVLGATTASVAPLRGPQNDSTRYAYCMVILPVYLLQYLFTVVITRFYYHPAPSISRPDPGLRELLSYRRDDAACGRLLSSDSDI